MTGLGHHRGLRGENSISQGVCEPCKPPSEVGAHGDFLEEAGAPILLLSLGSGSRSLRAGEGDLECSQVMWVRLDLGAAQPKPLARTLVGWKPRFPLGTHGT